MTTPACIRIGVRYESIVLMCRKQALRIGFALPQKTMLYFASFDAAHPGITRRDDSEEGRVVEVCCRSVLWVVQTKRIWQR